MLCFFSSIIRQFVWEFLTTKSVVPSCELTYPIISPFTNIFESMIFRLSPGGIWTRFFGGYLHFWCYNPYIWLGGGFKDFLFSPLFGEDSHFDSYFSKGSKPPTRYIWGLNVQSLQFSCFFLGPTLLVWKQLPGLYTRGFWKSICRALKNGKTGWLQMGLLWKVGSVFFC